ncbi:MULTISPECIES: type 1 glutamine amidotransferase [Clavibacter]|uniref:Lipid II isoglutaminyl synthase (glutamine-hydrolyzing) subunit GatD n=1 Tax=Clavibacter tessellarius TaxID=31965 RepID=A0A154V0D6_9MICO|nr:MULTISPECIES: glutamine amidotransferase [Clavibacter]KZC94823.1 glutamine amidotransferase [Clavibacter michiganensis subsp. tessellarius]MDA3805472.1 glutamine amidotransferase [Clavibacter sp. CT19]
MSDVLRILHLYPEELGINGDRGNVTVLVERARIRGIRTEVVRHAPGGGHPGDADIVFAGSGPLSAQRTVLPDLVSHAAHLVALQASGVPLLAVGGGLQLLGETVRLVDGGELVGAGVLPIRTQLTAARQVGDLVVDTADGELVGYENHGSTLDIRTHAPLGAVRAGSGNGGGQEGVRIGSSIGTHLGGPVLALNPRLADELLAAALARHGRELPADISGTLDRLDGWAREARATVMARPAHY